MEKETDRQDSHDTLQSVGVSGTQETPRVVGGWLFTAEMSWPLPDGNLEYRLRYGKPQGNDLIHAASILSAYEAMIQKTQKKRNYISMLLKWALKQRSQKQ